MDLTVESVRARVSLCGLLFVFPLADVDVFESSD